MPDTSIIKVGEAKEHKNEASNSGSYEENIGVNYLEFNE